MRRSSVVLGIAAGLGLLCGGVTAWRTLHPPPPETAHAAALSAIPVTTALGATAPANTRFVAPLPAQGAAPAAWTPLEASLSAKDCAACHVNEAAAWSGSRHAQALGAGVLGQTFSPRPTCDPCHAPLAEQAGESALASEGVTCAACHVRGWEHQGPPKADAPPMEGAPHGGFTPSTDFTDAQFCAACHDFSEKATAVEGKRLQETTEEWRRTPAAAAGKTCQDCHMPDGAHGWKGSYDLDTTRAAFTADARFITDGGQVVGRLRVTATEAVGHRLPTYTTAELWLTVDQLDRDGLILPGTHREGVIGRRLSPDNTEEVFDTRLLPGESHDLRYEAELDPDCRTFSAKVEMRPAAAYERRYADWLSVGHGDVAQLTTALEAAKAARFVAWQERVVLPE